jgi:hypothetical protein
VVSLTILVSCSASSISIVDKESAFPFLRNVESPENAMRWDSGTAIQLLSSCKLIRITRRGIRCIAANMELVSEWEKPFTKVGLPSESCQPHRHALCVMSNGDRFSPTDRVFVADGSVTKCVNGQNRQLVPEQDAQSNLRETDKIGGLVRRDDISLCDVLDTNLDVIYDPVNNQIFTKQLTNAAWLYITISFLILVVVVLMAEAFNNTLHSNLLHNIIAWVLLVVTSLIMFTQVDGRMHPIVTVQDNVFLCIVLVYITISTIYWIVTSRDRLVQERRLSVSGTTHSLIVAEQSNQGSVKQFNKGSVKQFNKGSTLDKSSSTPGTDKSASTPGTDKSASTPGTDKSASTGEPTKLTSSATSGPIEAIPPDIGVSETQRDGLNSMIASIQLATYMLYGTADNVYVSGIFFVLLFRCTQKIHNAHSNPEQWTIYANTVIVMDVTYTSLVFMFAVIPHYTKDTDTILYAAAQYVICNTIASNTVLNTAFLACRSTKSPPKTESAKAEEKKLATQNVANQNHAIEQLGPANIGGE